MIGLPGISLKEKSNELEKKLFMLRKTKFGRKAIKDSSSSCLVKERELSKLIIV